MKVCIIGTGPSGLTTIKQLLDEGHDVTCFEKNDDIGGIWFRNADDSDQMKVFDSLILTISMKLMSYSDFMVKDRVFYTHKKYLRYLNDYADR
jgi:dimethylaniline monooxygenase (N-oxide forming)